MSYILEALKKAQAERQLGSAPTLQAVPLGAAPAHTARKRRLPWVMLGGAVLALVAGGVVWRARTPAPAPAPAAAVVVPPPRHAPAPAVALAPAPVPPPMVVAPSSAPVPPPMVVAPSSAPVPPPMVVAPSSAPVPKPVPVKPAPAKAAPPQEEQLPSLRDLPDAIRGSVPQVAFGGYMYSANPADRLVLVDKALRHEGEEVAPGLVLEKLLPRAAVMNYRGYRYKVPY